MPDWLTHIGVAYFLGKCFGLRNTCWFLLGAVLPDVFSRTSYVLLDLFHFSKYLGIWVHLYLDVFHTPYICLFLSLSLASLTTHPKKVFGLLFGGSLVHFFLDLGQAYFHGGTPLFYPFVLKPFSLEWFWYDQDIVYLIVISISLLFIISLYLNKNKLTGVFFKWNSHRVLVSILFFIPALLTPYLTMEKLQITNYKSTGFLSHPARYEGKKVSLTVSKVISINPIMIDEAGFYFSIKNNTARPIKLGDVISLRGFYQDEVIQVQDIFIHRNKYFKTVLSLIGLVILLVIFLLSLGFGFGGKLANQNDNK